MDFPSTTIDIEEKVNSDEQKLSHTIARMIEETVKQRFASSTSNALAQRDAHGKAHGCVRGQFKVNGDLPHHLTSPVFQPGKEYDCYIRYSNGSGLSQKDAVGDGRGMAIKLLNVTKSSSNTQDFLLINHPTFFVKDASDYLDFQKATKKNKLLSFFFPGLNPFKWRLMEFNVAKAIRQKKVFNPLAIQYWSMTPFLFNQQGVKFSAKPIGPDPIQDQLDKTSDHFLKKNMLTHLSQYEAQFQFMVQLQTDSKTMPIEDPRVEWDEAKSPFIELAQINIPMQNFTSLEQETLCENLSFTPWHHVPEHRPLGGINRIRKVVYDAISKLRHKLNNVEEVEPSF